MTVKQEVQFYLGEVLNIHYNKHYGVIELIPKSEIYCLLFLKACNATIIQLSGENERFEKNFKSNENKKNFRYNFFFIIISKYQHLCIL